jgi:hypothetical protein
MVVLLHDGFVPFTLQSTNILFLLPLFCLPG